MLSTFQKRVSSGGCTPFASQLVRLVEAVEEHVSRTLDPCFITPRKSTSLKNWGATAHKRQRPHATPSNDAYWLLEHLYESLRLLVVGWEENNAQSLAVSYLRMVCGDKQIFAVSIPAKIRKHYQTIVDDPRRFDQYTKKQTTNNKQQLETNHQTPNTKHQTPNQTKSNQTPKNQHQAINTKPSNHQTIKPSNKHQTTKPPNHQKKQ
jgi:hypothetical protein